MYDEEQLNCLCETMYRGRDGEKLLRLFADCEPTRIQRSKSAGVVRARLYVLYHTGAFEQLYDEMKRPNYEPRFYDELQQLWFKAHYAEVEAKRRKSLGAVEKYRLRKKFPPPYTIWDGQETIYSFKENSRKMLRNCYEQNRYPSAEDKKAISERSGLSFVQVSNWFKNRRQRDKGREEGNDADDELAHVAGALDDERRFASAPHHDHHLHHYHHHLGQVGRNLPQNIPIKFDR